MKYLVAFAILSGCYYYYPKDVPKLNGALVVEGENITAEASTTDHYEDCTDYEYQHNECEVVHGKLKHPYKLYEVIFHYNGRMLTHAEFMELAMPDYPSRIKGIEDRKATCAVSLVPSALAVAAAAAAILVPTLMSDSFNDDQKEMIYYGGAGVAAGMGLLSYPLGGYACTKAADLAGGLLEDANHKSWVSGDPEELAAIVKLADEFNAKHGKPTALR